MNYMKLIHKITLIKIDLGCDIEYLQKKRRTHYVWYPSLFRLFKVKRHLKHAEKMLGFLNSVIRTVKNMETKPGIDKRDIEIIFCDLHINLYNKHTECLHEYEIAKTLRGTKI